MTFEYIEYLCGPRGCGREELLRAVVYLYGEGGACVSFLDLSRRRWTGPSLEEALRGGAEVASSDALYAGSPAKCREDGAQPVWLDVLTLDVDLKPPPVVARVEDGRVIFADRSTGEVVKRVSQSRLNGAVKELARRYRVRPAAIYDALYWGDGEYPSWMLILRKARRVKNLLSRLGVEAMYVYSGAKGFHVKLVLPRLYAAEARPVLARGLAQFLDVEADPVTFDVRRKFRIPWTVNKKTGDLAKVFDPVTGEEVKELVWPKPVDSLFIGFLLPAMRAPAEAPQPAARRRRSGAVALLVEVARRNPRLREDCRKRFTAAFGCFCATEQMPLETCAKLCAEALGFSEMPREYYSILKYRYSQCARREKPLFSVRELLTCRAGAWYCIKECVDAAPGGGQQQETSEEETAPGGQEVLAAVGEPAEAPRPAAEEEPGGQKPGGADAGVKDVDGRGPGGVKELFAAGWDCFKIEDAAEAERCMREKVEEIKRMFKGTRPWYE